MVVAVVLLSATVAGLALLVGWLVSALVSEGRSNNDSIRARLETDRLRLEAEARSSASDAEAAGLRDQLRLANEEVDRLERWGGTGDLAALRAALRADGVLHADQDDRSPGGGAGDAGGDVPGGPRPAWATED